eukprot:GHVU01142937.1.p1 GENE.GHVU01142937.1~~GHVU01142937.1.p1  ORF type:complete len:141 (-),score=2.95 GHVU01142937.1:404-826(-)
MGDYSMLLVGFKHCHMPLSEMRTDQIPKEAEKLLSTFLARAAPQGSGLVECDDFPVMHLFTCKRDSNTQTDTPGRSLTRSHTYRHRGLCILDFRAEDSDARMTRPLICSHPRCRPRDMNPCHLLQAARGSPRLLRPVPPL